MLIILAIVLAVIILILFAPLKMVVSFHNSDFRARVKLMGIPVYSYKSDNDKKKTSKKSVDSTVEDKVKSFERDTLSLGEKIKAIANLSRIGARLLNKYACITDVELKLRIGTGDAAVTAVSTGLLWAAIYNLLGIVGRIIFIDNHSIEISPDYSSEIYSAEGKCIIKSRIVYIIIIAITILLKINPVKGKED